MELVLVGALLLLVALAIGTMLLWLLERTKRLQIQASTPKLIDQARADAIKRSKSVVSGRVAEQLAPYLPGFEFNPREARFLGTPTDFVVFEGLDEGSIRGVTFVEVKAGPSAALTKHERSLRDCIERGDVRFVLFRHGNREEV